MFLAEAGYRILKEFLSLTITVFPYFILGTAFGAFLEVYLKPKFALKFFHRGTSSVINASILGALLPGCSCATIPMAQGLREKGARLGAVGSFIMVSPLLSPHTAVLTCALLGWRFTLARIIFSLTGAIILGVILNHLEKRRVKGFILQGSLLNDAPGLCSDGCKPRKKSFLKSFLSIIKDLSKYFLLGVFIASLLTVFIPEEAIPKYIGSSGAFAYLAAVLVGIPLYVCEGEEIPITLALLKLGLGTGPAFSFLLGSVGTCIPTMIMAQKVIGRKPTLFYIFYWVVFAIGSGLLFSLF
ncbi:MAG: permease [Candidatus Omnitrophota bacterium]